MKDKAVKYNEGKPKMSLIDHHCAVEQVKALEYGMNKYARNNYKKGLPFTEVIDALERHIGEFKEGQDNDQESGLPHTAHIQACAMMLSYMNQFRADMDDRGPFYPRTPKQQQDGQSTKCEKLEFEEDEEFKYFTSRYKYI